jgi:ribosome recycling factor
MDKRAAMWRDLPDRVTTFAQLPFMSLVSIFPTDSGRRKVMYKEISKDTRSRMEHVVEDFRRKLTTVRTGRATTGLLDGITVEYYGAPMPLNQVATINVPEASMITLQPFDPSLISEIEKAIRSSDLGLNPANDGKLIRVPIPALTEERRKQMVKVIHEMAEDHKTAIRNVRRDSNDKLKKALKEKQISEDEERGGLDEVQKLTDQFVAKIAELSKHKEDEILKV